jgi:hypothetical protein
MTGLTGLPDLARAGATVGHDEHRVGRLIDKRHECVPWLNAPCRLDKSSQT